MEALRKYAILELEKQVDGAKAENIHRISLAQVAFLLEPIQSFINLKSLSLVCMRPPLRHLFTIPFESLPHMRYLNVSDNRIGSSDIPIPNDTHSLDNSGNGRNSSSSPNIVNHQLSELYLTNNNITEIDFLRPVFPNLKILDLLDNPIEKNIDSSEISAYRSNVFTMWPNLLVLSGISLKGEEIDICESDETDESVDSYSDSSTENSSMEKEYSVSSSVFSDDLASPPQSNSPVRSSKRPKKEE